MTIAELHDVFLRCSQLVSTDTRSLQKKGLYFALKGENFNGNTFAEEAISKGASYAVIDEKKYHLDSGKTILVQDVLQTLQELAVYHRKKLALPILALTGSNGKTTTKELIHAVLASKMETVATEGNLNNHIGVPLTLLRLKPSTAFGVVEMGANHLGEIAHLCRIAQPDFGYITNFGKAHMEGFGGIDGIIQGKSELYNYLREHQKTAFIHAEDPLQLQQAKGIRQVTFGSSPESDYTISCKESSPFVHVQFNNKICNTQLTGKYNFANIAAAVAIGKHFQVPDNTICEAISTYLPKNNRSQWLEKNSNKILLDAYNANPSSMEAALQNFSAIDSPSKVVFLADMFELGEASAEEHEKITQLSINSGFERIYLVGNHFYHTKSTASILHKFQDFAALKAFLLETEETPKNKTILIKGSRGMAMERLLELL